MVKIRLSRAGAKKHPYYHIIAIDERSRRGRKAAAANPPATGGA